jgi:hypothetical protein
VRFTTNLILACAFTLPSFTVPIAAAQSGPVPAEWQGTWVPVKAACESPVRVVITADRLTLMNGNDKQAIGGIEMAGPAYWGPDYHGIEAVLITEFDGQQPVTATFNVGEKKGVAQVAFAPVQPGAAGNALLAAYNKRITELNLAKRFPLHEVSLKKCAAGSGADAGAAPAKQAPTE